KRDWSSDVCSSDLECNEYTESDEIPIVQEVEPVIRHCFFKLLSQRKIDFLFTFISQEELKECKKRKDNQISLYSCLPSAQHTCKYRRTKACDRCTNVTHTIYTVYKTMLILFIVFRQGSHTDTERRSPDT